MTGLKAYWLENKTPVKVGVLEELGVTHWKLDPAKHKDDAALEAIKKERGYTYSDYVLSTNIPDLAGKLDNFKVEHLHDDEEIRFFLDGSGYFDVKAANDEYIRIHCQPGDMLTLPAGIYHRFIPDEKMFFHVMRLFKGDPVWTPWNRCDEGTEARESRLNYVTKYLSK